MDLNTILIILGILALIGLVAYGIWSNRRERSQYFDNENAFHRNPQSSGRPSAQTSQPMTPNFAQPAKETEQIRQTYQEPQVRQTSSPSVQQPQTTAQAMPEDHAEPDITSVQSEQQTLNFDTAEKIKITLPNTDTTAGAARPVHYEYHAEPSSAVNRQAPQTAAQDAVYPEHAAVPDMQVFVATTIGRESDFAADFATAGERRPDLSTFTTRRCRTDGFHHALRGGAGKPPVPRYFAGAGVG